MKITAEFNSNEELLSFIHTFGTKVPAQSEGFKISRDSNSVAKEEKPAKKESKKQEASKVEAEVVDVKTPEGEVKDAEVKEDKVTFEMVRAVFAKLLQKGKSKEAKELTIKYGAAKLPELKEEHFADVLKEAEALL